MRRGPAKLGGALTPKGPAKLGGALTPKGPAKLGGALTPLEGAGEGEGFSLSDRMKNAYIKES